VVDDRSILRHQGLVTASRDLHGDRRLSVGTSVATKDGKATFVETQTARSEAEHSYSYTFKSSPLPVTGYASTIKVVPKSDGVSTVIWSSTYVPDLGKEQDAREALTGIYEAGLATIKAKFTK